MLTPSSLLALILVYRYWILFPIAFFEGPVLSLVLGFLVSAGYLHFLPTCLVLVAGNAVPDTVYYLLGRYGTRLAFIERNIHRAGLSPARMQSIEHMWQEHTFKAMFVAKWALGITIPFLLLAGMSRMTYRKYIACATIVGFVNYLILLTIGFTMEQSYAVAAKYIEGAGIVITGLVVIAIGAFFYYEKRLSRKIVEYEIMEERS